MTRAEVLASDYAWALDAVRTQSAEAMAICDQIKALAQDRANAYSEEDFPND